MPIDMAKHDEFTRSIMSEKALTLIDGLPALLKNDTLDVLMTELVEAHQNYARAIRALEELCELPEAERTQELTHGGFRFEYIARKTMEMYRAEIESREGEARKGLH